MGKYKRVLLKLSGEALMGKEKSSKVLDKDVLFKPVTVDNPSP